jgi:hypothetical protein
MKVCTHERYKSGHYMTAARALRMMESKDPDDPPICQMGIRIKNCEDCGADIYWADIVPVKTVSECLQELGMNLSEMR